MNRKQAVRLHAAFVLTLLLLLLAWNGRPSAGATLSRRPVRAAHVTVVAGKPTEFRFTLSQRAVRRGVVVFRVLNRGKIVHDFEIRGKKTRRLRPGRVATVRVAFGKAGRYAYLCTLPGHAAAGMHGFLRVRS